MNNLLTQKFPIAAFALLFVLTMSCSHEPAVNDSNNPNGSNVHEWEDSTIDGNATMTRMAFSVGDSINVVRQGQTRATTTIAGVTTFQVNDIVTIGVAGKSAKDYKVTNTTSGALAYNGTATDAYCWQSTSETVSLRAWSYGNTTTNSGDPDDAVYSLPTDQSSNYGELLYAPATNYDYATYNSSIPITLYHQLARLVINLEHIKTGDLNVSEIYIGDGTDAVIPTTAKFHKPTSGNIGTWDNIGTEKGKITPKTETANACYSAVLIPGTYAANQKFMVIKTSDSRTYCYIPTSPIVLAAGNQYNYTISVKDLKEVSTLTIADIAAYTYDGTAKEPHPTVTDGSKTLTEGTDYTLSWSNNTNAGTATVTVTGMGGYYNGTQNKTFTINKATPTLSLSATSLNVYRSMSKTITATLGNAQYYDGTIVTTWAGSSPVSTTTVGSLSTASGSQKTQTITLAAGANEANAVTLNVTTTETNNYNAVSVPVSCSVQVRGIDISQITAGTTTNNPLYYVSDREVNSSATGFTTPTNSGSSVYWQDWNYTMNKFVGNTTSKSGYNSTSIVNWESTRWVLPTKEMWLSIVPGPVADILEFESSTIRTEASSCFKIAQTVTAYKSYWSDNIGTSPNLAIYAIRFIGTNYCSVWKYSLEGTRPSSPSSTSNWRLVIKSKVITSTIYPINSSTFSDTQMLQNIIDAATAGTFDWTGCETRTFYSFGVYHESKRQFQGQRGYIWSATTGNPTNAAWVLDFSTNILLAQHNVKSSLHNVRLFKD